MLEQQIGTTEDEAADAARTLIRYVGNGPTDLTWQRTVGVNDAGELVDCIVIAARGPLAKLLGHQMEDHSP